VKVKVNEEYDREVMARVAAGDRASLATLYDEHASRMLALAYRILGNRRDAEDLLHDVFLEAWQKAASFDPARGSVRAWLLMRVRSRAIDRIRMLTTARQRLGGVMSVNAEPMSPAVAPDSSSDHRRARMALQQLPESQRAVIELSYFEGMTCREIGAHCSIPVGTVKSRLSAGIRKLRREFGSERRPALQSPGTGAL
jgi:RNA polymerase sigma-70 factor (ECF subfamily)